MLYCQIDSLKTRKGPYQVHRRSGFPPEPSNSHHYDGGNWLHLVRSPCAGGKGKSHREQVFCITRYFPLGCRLNPRAVKVYSFQKPREKPGVESAPEGAVNRVLIELDPVRILLNIQNAEAFRITIVFKERYIKLLYNNLLKW